MKYKEDWTLEEKAHKNPCKKCEKHEKHEKHDSCKDICKKMRVINLWKFNSK
ncbi:hypothetical protein WKH56_33820 [Priestia sp. SB1]|uniref:hypothetical protein n=1 Tax=Priestia sp. SB1 TaxID=3132359 RepID=UPI0031706CF7